MHHEDIPIKVWNAYKQLHLENSSRNTRTSHGPTNQISLDAVVWINIRCDKTGGKSNVLATEVFPVFIYSRYVEENSRNDISPNQYTAARMRREFRVLCNKPHVG